MKFTRKDRMKSTIKNQWSSCDAKSRVERTLLQRVFTWHQGRQQFLQLQLRNIDGTHIALDKSMHRQLWPWLPCLREELIIQSEIHRLIHPLMLGHSPVHVVGYLYGNFLGSEMRGSQWPIQFAWDFYCNRQSSREKNFKQPKKPQTTQT